jgi:hypothetical protein
MTGQTPPRPVVVRRVRITGLTGAAPTAEAIRTALADALRSDGAATSTSAPLSQGATLTDAARAAAARIKGRSR